MRTRHLSWLSILLLGLTGQAVYGQQRSSVADLVKQFENETVFWRQFEVAQAIVEAGDKSVLPGLEPWLTHADRRLRGNAAFIFGRLGDARGLDVITAILSDRSELRTVRAISSMGSPSLPRQNAEDRYYAAHLLGDLKDARAVPILVPLLKDREVRDIVPWSLEQIGDRGAVAPLIEATSDPDPGMRVMAIYALADLQAAEALPRLRELLNDSAKSNFGKLETVGEAARVAILKLQPAGIH